MKPAIIWLSGSDGGRTATLAGVGHASDREGPCRCPRCVYHHYGDEADAIEVDQHLHAVPGMSTSAYAAPDSGPDRLVRYLSTPLGGLELTDALAQDQASVPLTSENGRIRTEALEINAAWHCNISCEWCSHASPVSARKFADPQLVVDDLAGLARWMQVDHVRILGGEPLLHPQLVQLLEGTRSSGISGRIRVLTNGLALHTTPPRFWDLVDEVHVSVYPSTARAVERRVNELRESAAAAGTTLILKYFDRFRVAYREPEDDPSLTQRIYQTCQVANLWRCLTVEQGRLYRCPQSTHVHTAVEYAAFRSGHGIDYLEIDDIGSSDEVLAWMRRQEALTSCQVCTGSAGTLQPHRQIIATRRAEASDVVDHTFLTELEQDITADNSCVSRDVVLWQTGS